MTHTAPAPDRIARKATITFGQANIAVALYTGAEATKPKATKTTGVKAPAPVGVRAKNKVTGRSVPDAAVYEVVEATDGTKVKFTPEERKQAQLVDGPYAIEAIVPVGELGTVYFPTAVYQIRADVDPKVGGAENERKLELLFATLDAGEHALVQLPLKTGEAPVVCLINNAGYLLVCHYSDAVRQPLPLAKGEFSATEVVRAARVTAKLRGTIVPTHNRAAERIQAAIDAKAEAGTDVVRNTVPVKV